MHDRIDIIYHAGDGVTVQDVDLIGHLPQFSDLVVQPYPSDHRAVVGRFELDVTLPGLLGDINLDDRVDQLDADILVANWLMEFESPGLESYTHGDLDVSGLVDLSDLAILQRGYIEFGGAAPLDLSGIGRDRVPEPSAWWLAAISMVTAVTSTSLARKTMRCAK